MYTYCRFLFLVAVILLTACGQQNNAGAAHAGEDSFSADSLKQRIAVLSADSFLGRKPFTEGETKTIAYLQGQFASIGLEAGNKNSFLQDVPMVNLLATAAPSMEVNAPKGNFILKAFDDYIIWTDKPDSNVQLDKAPLVFAGYGVIAPEYNWNDYAGLDVKGKVVMVMVNDPGFWSGDTSLFKGKEMTYYGRWTYKYEEAARQGAKGCLIIHNTAAASYPFAVQQNNFNTSRLQLDNRGKDRKNCDVIGWITEPAANRLFIAAGLDSTLLQKANLRGCKSVPLPITVSTSMKVKVNYNKSYNVIGKITGTKHPDEVIIYSAHWDHLGVGTPDEKGDSIYNGALDNASGTAGLLELARAFQRLPSKPERTIVFLALTAEEQGLLGSAYYAENPVYPAAKTVANINIDGLYPYASTKDMVIIGAGQSELEDYFAEAVEEDSGYIAPVAHPEAGLYYRSDHFNFAKAGIPALYVEPGIDVVGKGRDYGKQMADEYQAKHYHRPSDEYDALGWSMEGGIHQLKLLFRVGKRLAFEDKMPQWKAGSEFKAIREKQLK